MEHFKKARAILLGRMLGVLAVLCLAATAAQARESVRLANGEFSPYQSETLKHYGMLSRIVSEAFALEGVDVEYGFFPWKRSYELVKRGEWEGSFAWQKNPERELHFLFSDQLYMARQAFFHLRKRAFHWETYDDLSGYTFGASLGYSYGEEFDGRAASGEITVQWVATDELNFNKIIAGRIEAFPCNVEIGYHILRTKFSPTEAERITHHPRLLTTGAPLYLMVSKKAKDGERVIEMFNRGLRKLRESGKFERFVLESRRGEYIR